MILLGWDPLLNPTDTAYDRPIFEGVRSIAPLGTWGVMFWTVGIILAVAAISGRAAIYVIGLMGALLALGGWCFAIIVQSYVDPEAHLTSGALGFYLLAGTAVLGLALSPQQIEHESKIIGVIGADGEPVALRRVSEIQTKTG